MDDEKALTMYDLKKSLLQTLEDNKAEILNSKYPEDLISEYVDGEIPVYTGRLLEIALSDLWLAVDEPEMYGFDGKPTAINAIVGNIYSELHEEASNWLNLAQEEKQTVEASNA
jgi:hypothetical protein